MKAEAKKEEAKKTDAKAENSKNEIREKIIVFLVIKYQEADCTISLFYLRCFLSPYCFTTFWE
jgi:hypothetical protein